MALGHSPQKHQLKTTPYKPSPKAIERRIKARSNSVTSSKGVDGASRKNPQAGRKMGVGFGEKVLSSMKKDQRNPAGIQRINKFKGFK